MTDNIDHNFIKALHCEPEKRTLQDLQIIYYGLHSLEPLSTYRDSVLRSLCKLVRYEKHQTNEILFYTGEVSTCWYILLSGVVFMAGSMFLPGSSFGKRNGGSVRRPSECFVLETSKMIVIDYPELSVNLANPLQQLSLSSHLSIVSSGPALTTSSSSIGLVQKAGGGTNNYGSRVFISQPSTAAASTSSINHQYSASARNSFNSVTTHHSSQQQLLLSPVSGGGGCGSVGGGVSSNSVVGISSGQSQSAANLSCVSTNSSNNIPTIVASGGTGGNSTCGGGGGVASVVGQPLRGQLSSPYGRQQSLCCGGGANTTHVCGGPGHLTNMDHHHLRHVAPGVNVVFDDNQFVRPELYQKCNRGSHSSDTSSAYSGSDTMTSVHSSSLDADEVDLSGLVESVVDSDEEDLAESMDSLAVRDTVRECLEKDPSDRTDDDIEILLEFTKNLKAFTNMTLAVRRALCAVMVFAVVEKAGTMVMNDGEELDSWSVLINGHVEIEHSNGEKEELQVGDSFGILPTMDKLYHRGIMRTKCDDCQFVCITQTDYYRIQHQGEENTKKHEEDGRVVMVTELRHGAMDGGSRRGHVVIRGTPDRLMLQLIEENSMTDPTYVEDFLLTHRTFVDNPHGVAQTLLNWFENESTDPLTTTASSFEIRDRVTRVILLWVNNHFTDFETDPQMMEFLEIFEAGLETKSMHGQLRLLHIACAAKARTRNVTLARSSRDENLHFTIVGGYERGGYGIFISKVDKKSKPEDVGLKRGDQILEVNGQSFEHVTLAKAMEIITGTTHLSITVKSNLLAYKEMLQMHDTNSPRPRNARKKVVSDIAKLQASDPHARLSTVELLSQDQTDCAPQPPKSVASSSCDTGVIAFNSKKDSISSSSSSSSASSHKGGFMTLGPKRRLQKALIKMNLLPKTAFLDSSPNDDDSSTIILNTQTQTSGSNSVGVSSTMGGNGSQSVGLYHSHSNPDLSTVYYDDSRNSDYPEHVLKVYKADQTCKYLLVHKETTAHEVVMLALQEFGIHETSSNFSLCEVSVGEGGMIKQRRLPDQLQNLAERIGLSSRYYLRTNGITETLVPDEMAPELIRESNVHFLQLNPNEVAIQLTFQDFAIFRQIESTEYVDDLFELNSKYGVPMLKQFAELVNREMFWVVTEVCSEHNIVRRMKIIKQFIKIARHCKECRNFNSMFAIISGLGHAAVSRLRMTWEKLPSKYQKLFNDLQELMDPSRNMSKYRQLVSSELMEQHPIIPFYPVVKKDLTFIHLGNDTHVERLINFEKLRMIAKEVRCLTHMCSSTYDLLTMLELKGQPPSSAMVALNQMSVSTGSHGQHQVHVAGVGGQSTVKRRKKSTAAPNPKKMFEEAQMVRRVKAYLHNMKVFTDEDALHNLSLECEPSGGSAPSSVQIRKRHPSPTLSTTSSTSSTSEGKKGVGLAGPKFGAASPQAVKKILSLSEQNKTRPHQPRHPGLPLPLGTAIGHHHSLHHNLHHATSVSPSPSPGAHRRMGSSSSAGTAPYATHGFPHNGGRAVHERSHSDTPTPLPSVDLSVESSSVTSLSNLPLRKTITSGSETSCDSGHSSCLIAESNSNCSDVSSLYHVATSGLHSSSSPTTQPNHHSTMHGSTGVNMYCPQIPNNPPPPLPPTHHSLIHETAQSNNTNPPIPPPLPPSASSTAAVAAASAMHNMASGNTTPPRPPVIFPHGVVVLPPLPSLLTYVVHSSQQQYHTQQQQQQQQQQHRSNNGHVMPGPQIKGYRHPPAYSVAAQMARYHRLGRAHSHEGVTSSVDASCYHSDPRDEDDDDGAQVSAV